MKNYFLKITLLLILSAGSLCSCQDDTDDLFLEISPNSQSQVIEQEIDGIIFKFCLLNEQGEPATVFKEGENIIFNFSLKNSIENSVSIPTQFINDDFYRVYGNDNTNMGKAWTGVWCEFRNESMMIALPSHAHKQLNCPWLLSNSYQPDYPLCKGNTMNPLPRGVYSTTLHFDFYYIIGKQQKSIENIEFKINFQIK